MLRTSELTVLVASALLLTGCGGGGSSSQTQPSVYDPDINPAKFVTEIDNPFWPAMAGNGAIYEGETSDGDERVEIQVSFETKTILGIECTVIVDRGYEDDELVEETFDWYAQDVEGNVWYFGELSTEFEDGFPVSNAGSWESGLDDAKPGIVMLASPRVGDSYRQEYLVGVAEDMAEVVSLNESVQIGNRTYTGCLKTKETTPLEPDVLEFKYYAPGVGLILETEADGSDGLELIETTDDKAPEINPEDFDSIVDNPLFPLTPGTTFIYEGETEDGLERVETKITAETRVVMGVSCVVVLDREYEDGELVEETYDWYAQDLGGNVWYFGEDSTSFEDGDPINKDGSWEAGVDGAQPGIIMLANPRPGDSYRQEYYPGEALDIAAVVSANESLEVPFGDYDDCLMTLEWNPLEPGVSEFKFYAPEIGLIQEGDELEPVQLIEIHFE